jgi:hypothetical protein
MTDLSDLCQNTPRNDTLEGHCTPGGAAAEEKKKAAERDGETGLWEE